MNELTVSKKASELIDLAFSDAGISESKPFEVLARLLDAKKMTVDKYGEEHYEEDNTAQGKAVELALRLKRLLDNKLADFGPVAVQHHLAPDDIARLEGIAKELKTLESRLNKDKVQQGIIEAAHVVTN